MTTMILLAATLLLFVAIDAVWLTLVTAPEFRETLGAILRPTPKWSAAVLFYLLYAGAMVWFVIGPGAAGQGSLFSVALNGAALGLLAYGTYELTSMSTVKGWTWHLVMVDTGWGMFLTACVSVIIVWAARALSVNLP